MADPQHHPAPNATSPPQQLLYVPAPAAPPAPPRHPFNPTWLGVGLSIAITISGAGATYRDVTELREWRKTMDAWKSTQEVSSAELRKDVIHIKEGVDALQRSIPSVLEEMRRLALGQEEVTPQRRRRTP